MCTLALWIVGATRADVVYENFGPNDDFDSSSGWVVGLGFPLWEMAEPFRVTDGSYALDQIELPIGLVIGDNQFFVHLAADNNGKPGKVLESFNVVGAMELWVDITGPVVIPSQQHPTLKKGDRYWVVAAATVETHAVWSWNSIDDVGPHGSRKDRGVWNINNAQRGAFRVTGTFVDP
jgi:hypothetical protein